MALRLADDPQQKLPAAAETLLEADYGVTHPDALDVLIPRICATYQALNGLLHDDSRVDALVRRQIRHSLTLDAQPRDRTTHITWSLDGTGQRIVPIVPTKPRRRRGS